MNYLAHLYLSGTNEKTMVGNFIGDYVKGRNWDRFPKEIKDGILLHRQIDTFTDAHPRFREAKQLFRKEFGLYSGIIIDFLYDHYLAKNWNHYHDSTLRDFAKHAHAVLLQNFRFLPVRVQGFLPFLIQNRRLESYASVNGIIESIKIMSRYSTLPEKSEFIIQTMNEKNDYFSENFRAFMSDLIRFVNDGHNMKLNIPAFSSVMK
jgi:acyl carrier protein phosphodiesterase